MVHFDLAWRLFFARNFDIIILFVNCNKIGSILFDLKEII